MNKENPTVLDILNNNNKLKFKVYPQIKMTTSIFTHIMVPKFKKKTE